MREFGTVYTPTLCPPSRFALELFSRKLMALAGDRLELLCSDGQLSVSPGLLDLVWALVHHILSVLPTLSYRMRCCWFIRSARILLFY